MKIFVFASFIVCLVTILFPVEVSANSALDVYMNDFYSKSNEASQILEEIENTLKDQAKLNRVSKNGKLLVNENYNLDTFTSKIKSVIS